MRSERRAYVSTSHRTTEFLTHAPCPIGPNSSIPLSNPDVTSLVDSHASLHASLPPGANRFDGYNEGPEQARVGQRRAANETQAQGSRRERAAEGRALVESRLGRREVRARAQGAPVPEAGGVRP